MLHLALLLAAFVVLVGRALGSNGFPPSLKPGCLPSDGSNNTDLYCPGDSGYGCYKIPTIMQTRKGTLLAMIEARKFSCDDQGFVDLLLRRSVDGGVTWSKPQKMYGNSTELMWTTVGDGNWVQDATTGIIWLLHTRNNSQLFLSRSSDDGVTWSGAVDVSATLKTGYPTEGWVGTGHSGGLQLSAGPTKGRLIIPTYAPLPYIVYSDDQGKTWRKGSTIPAETYSHGGSAGEWTLSETGAYGADGTPVLLASVRNSPKLPDGTIGKGYRLQSLSRDGGLTWSTPWEVHNLPEPIEGCEGSLVFHPGTQKIYFSHPNPRLDLFRTRLTVWSSSNMGASWDEHTVLWDSAAGYSSMSVLHDGRIGVFYDRNNHTMLVFEAQSVSWTTFTA